MSHISWQVRFLISACAGYIFAPFFIKILSSRLSRGTLITLQYGFIFAGLAIYALLGNYPEVSGTFFFTIGLGIANFLACYAQWRAYDISLSRASLFSFSHDLIALLLGVVFLGDSFPVASSFFIGLAFIGIATLLIGYRGYTEIRSVQDSHPVHLRWWIVVYVFIWGTTGFLMRYFALNALPVFEFGFGFYLGSFLSALAFSSLSSYHKSPLILPNLKETLLVFLLSLFIFISTLGMYWTLEMAPLTVVKPLEHISGLVLPIVAGLFVFNEKKDFSLLGWIGLSLGIIGGILIAFV